MQFSPEMTTVTREYILPKIFDTINHGTPTLLKMVEDSEAWTSGTRYEMIYQYTNPTNGGNVGIASQLSTSRDNTRVRGYFEPKMAVAPVIVADIEDVLNRGEEQIIPIMTAEFNTAGKYMANIMSANLFGGTGVGDEWDSLNNAADDGTNFPTYAGLSRTTYPSLDGYLLTSAGALTLAKMATAYDAVTIGTDTPNMISTTKSLWSKYEALLTPTVRAGYAQNGYPTMATSGLVPMTDGLKGNQGFSVLWFRGTPIVRDEQVQSGRMFFINSTYFGLKGIDMSVLDDFAKKNFSDTTDGTPKGVPGREKMSRSGFNFRQMMSPVNQLSKVGYIVQAGNFCSGNPRLQGQMQGLT